MVNCSYCGKELDRKVYCSASHKVMDHRKLTEGKPSKDLPKVNPKDFIWAKEKIVPEDKITLCKHGRKVGLCEHRCKK